MDHLFDQLEDALAWRDVAGVRDVAERVAAGAGDIRTLADRIALLFDLADWLWDAGAHDGAIQATAAALQRAATSHALDPVDLGRRLDRLATRLEADGHHSMAAEVWKRAIDVSIGVESEGGRALAWRLNRYLDALQRVGAPAGQIAAIRERLARLQPLGTPPQSPAAAPAPERSRAPGAPVDTGMTRSGPVARPAPESLGRPQREITMPHQVQVPEVGAAGPPPKAGPPAIAADDAYHKVPVHFATHRILADATNPYETFGYTPAPAFKAHYGIVHVTVPVQRDLGTLPTRGWLASMYSDRDPARHMTITTIDILRRSECLASAERRMADSARKEALVFVHGYNNSFTDAAFRCAQLAVDLDIDGVPFLYSWPSKASTLSILADKEHVANAEFHRDLSEFLADIKTHTRAERIHLVGHSLGVQMLVASLHHMQVAKGLVTEPLFDQIVLASPAMALDQFRPVVQRVSRLGRRTTVYASQSDIPLKIAGWLGNGARAGLNAAELASLKGVEAIDTTKAPDDFYAHGSFAARAIDDLQGVVWLSLEPGLRKRLQRVTTPGGAHYWIYDPDKPAGAFFKALARVRELGVARALQAIATWLEGKRGVDSSDPEVAEQLALKAEIEQLKGALT
ncbi:MAG: alpha/beta hydrolase [Hyphomicrobiaceae bacterium]